MKTNYHTHSKWSDGKLNPEKMVQEAIKQGFSILGFSDHSPVPFKSDWNMKYENLLKYIADISTLKEKYKDQIKIFLGLEADYIEGVSDFHQYKKFNLDYIIGGIHYLPEKFEDGTIFNIDESPELFEKGINELYGGDPKNFVKEYYKALNKMIKNSPPDILAHFDIVEKFNKGNKYFNANENWYKNLVAETLDLIYETNIIIELNPRSKYKGLLEDYNPSSYIVDEIVKRKIPMTISGDVHAPNELSLFWDDSVKYLKSKNIEQIMIFEGNGWKYQTLN